MSVCYLTKCRVIHNLTLLHLAMRMATSVGKIDPFNPTNGEAWAHYVEHLEYYFLTNGITAADKK